MKSELRNKNEQVKEYYEGLRLSVGLKSKEIARRLGITNVAMCYLSFKLDEMSGKKLLLLCDMLGVDIGVFLRRIKDIRNGSDLDT